ncbi:IS3 family transposase [uncultured Muribaculum sp.]
MFTNLIQPTGIQYYNNIRIKSRLKGKSPVQYRTLSQSR